MQRRHRSPERQTPPELANSTTGKQELWQPDEAAVKAGLCSFHVKVKYNLLFLFTIILDEQDFTWHYFPRKMTNLKE